MLKAVLFDMDGLMIDTEPLQSRAYEKVLRDLGKEPVFNDGGVVQTVGVREKDNWEIIKQAHALDHNTDDLVKRRSGIYVDILKREVAAQPGL